MERIAQDRDWQFYVGKSHAFEEPGEKKQSETIHLPHDFVIASEPSEDAASRAFTGYYGGGIGCYEKYLDIPAQWRGKKIILEFDGVYNNTTVGLNGDLLAFHPYGYTPFHVDLTRHIEYGGKNRLHVRANNTALPNSRWYTGGGIYRHVDLLVSEPVYIKPWGIFAYVDHCDETGALVVCEVAVRNETMEDRKLSVKVVLRDDSGKSVAECIKHIFLSADSAQTVRTNHIVENVRRWDIDDPYLYHVSAEIIQEDGEVLDRDDTAFGIRTITVDTKNGFRLNGRKLKLKGGCVHHDNGILGAASYRDSEYRKMLLHKENGYNAIRCAHNPPSREMLDACDRLGLLVIDEAFDKWRMERNPNDFHLFFEDWWERDLESFILRDRNHPSIIMWSTGNEVDERGGLGDGYAWAEKLADRTRKLDPTRFVTNALCSLWSGLSDKEAEAVAAERKEGGDMQNINTAYMDKIFGELTERFAAPLDVVGYNYLESRYESDGITYPDRVICGMESFAMEIDRIWDKVERLPHVIGDFAWTSYDYIGEAGIGKSVFSHPEEAVSVNPGKLMAKSSCYPWRLANDADFDICGFDRPQLHYRKIVWGSKETYIAVQDPARYGMKETISRWGWPECEADWNWKGSEGKPVCVTVYSAAPKVALFLNGVCIGEKAAGKENRYQAEFVVSYCPGELKAVSCWENGETSAYVLETTGEAAAVKLIPETELLRADGQSLAFITVEIVDADGKRVPDAQVRARASVTGEASLAAFGSANPMTEENYTAGIFTSFRGRLLAIVRAAERPGMATLCVQAEGLPAVQTEISVR